MMMRGAAPVMKSMAMSSAPMVRSSGGGGGGGGGGPGGAPQGRRTASAPAPPIGGGAPGGAPAAAPAAAPTAASGTKRELPDSDGSGSDGGDLTVLLGAVDKVRGARAGGAAHNFDARLGLDQASAGCAPRPQRHHQHPRPARAEGGQGGGVRPARRAEPLRRCLSAQLVVVACATQGFEDSVLDMVVQRNVNPIERAETAALVLAATVHGHAAATGAGAEAGAGAVAATAGRINAARLVSGQHLERAGPVHGFCCFCYSAAAASEASAKSFVSASGSR